MNYFTHKNMKEFIKHIKWLKLLNILILQWLFIRLTKCSVDVVENYKLKSYDLIYSDDISCDKMNISKRGIGNIKKYSWYSFQYFILPITGWFNIDFILISYI